MEIALTQSGSQVESRSYQGAKKDDVDDLEAAHRDNRRFLYYLLGKARKGNFDFAVCDVEVLRYLIKLHDASYRPERLFDTLREKHLLLLGVNFSDWLARFFLWLAKARANENFPNRALREYLADQKARDDKPLVVFLKHFSDTTRVVEGDPEKFVEELYRRWAASKGQDQTDYKIKIPEEMPQFGIFLSYSRTDQAAVQNFYAQLTAAGIPAWYDARLEGGDLWRDKIRSYIETCSVFIPILSVDALRREKGIFRAEWRQAVELDQTRYGTLQTGIIPIVVDSKDEILKATKPLQGLPDALAESQMYHCPGGKATRELLDRLKRLVQKASGTGA